MNFYEEMQSYIPFLEWSVTIELTEGNEHDSDRWNNINYLIWSRQRLEEERSRLHYEPK